MSNARFDCPHCGAVFRSSRIVCPECGSDSETGWRDAEDIDYQSVEIPDYYGEDDDAPAAKRRRAWFLFAAFAALAGMFAFALLR